MSCATTYFLPWAIEQAKDKEQSNRHKGSDTLFRGIASFFFGPKAINPHHSLQGIVHLSKVSKKEKFYLEPATENKLIVSVIVIIFSLA